MKNSIHELVKDAIETYFLHIDLSDIIEIVVKEELDNMDFERILNDTFDIESIVADELEEVLEEMFG